MSNLNDLYSEVFSLDGAVKACGRDKCKELIAYLSKLYPDKYFGDIDTGFLNIEAIKEVIK